jgi:hypothetical protein
MSDDTKRPEPSKSRPPNAPASAVSRWNHAVREAYAGSDARADADARAVLEASDEEIERQLREAGFDLDAENAKADATYEAMLAKHFPHAVAKASPALDPASDADQGADAEPAWVATTESNVVAMPRKPTRSAWVVWLIAAALATAGAAYVAGHRPEPPPSPPPEAPKEAPTTVTPKPTPPAPVPPVPAPAPEPDRPSPKAPH